MYLSVASEEASRVITLSNQQKIHQLDGSWSIRVHMVPGGVAFYFLKNGRDHSGTNLRWGHNMNTCGHKVKAFIDQQAARSWAASN